jgi:hypothetical protein
MEQLEFLLRHHSVRGFASHSFWGELVLRGALLDKHATHMLQHIDANHGIKAGIAVGQRLAQTHVIADAQFARVSMGAGGLDGIRGGIDPGDTRAAGRQRLGQEAPGAAEVEHILALPVDPAVELFKPP